MQMQYCTRAPNSRFVTHSRRTIRSLPASSPQRVGGVSPAAGVFLADRGRAVSALSLAGAAPTRRDGVMRHISHSHQSIMTTISRCCLRLYSLPRLLIYTFVHSVEIVSFVTWAKKVMFHRSICLTVTGLLKKLLIKSLSNLPEVKTSSLHLRQKGRMFDLPGCTVP